MSALTPFLARAVAALIVGFARAVTGVRAAWQGCEPGPRQRIYVANHTSHGDFVLIWTVLPAPLRRLTRPVAAADYWGRAGLCGFVGRAVFNAVLVERGGGADKNAALEPLHQALGAGDSLIFFPEGTRNMGDDLLLPLKSGLYHLALAHPAVEVVPVWIDNISRVMPKGEVLPVPLLCKVSFGAPLLITPGEEKAAFLERVRAGMIALAPPECSR